MIQDQASVELGSELVSAAQAEAGFFDRSPSSQIEHWVRLGKAAERIARFPERIRLLLDGMLKIEDLTEGERAAYYDAVPAVFAHPPAALRDAYQQIGAETRAALAAADAR